MTEKSGSDEAFAAAGSGFAAFSGGKARVPSGRTDVRSGIFSGFLKNDSAMKHHPNESILLAHSLIGINVLDSTTLQAPDISGHHNYGKNIPVKQTP
jgi:hypothetical protein